MRFLYNIFLQVYRFGIYLASFFNSKAEKWIEGRKNLLQKLETALKGEERIIWVHVASLGEFEQARPVIERFKNDFPSHKVLLTFFSPSGYEVRKHYPHADFVFYLPLDTPKNAKRFISIVNPKLAVFVKYEFWFNYIDKLYKNKIPLLMISVIFRPSQHFFKFWGGWFKRQLGKVTWFFVQNDRSLKLLGKIGVFHAEKAGDTRFDRVYQMASNPKVIPEVKAFKCDKPMLVMGSTWKPDELLIKKLLVQLEDYRLKVVIAPHETGEARIKELLDLFSDYNPVLFTRFPAADTCNSRVLIMNTTGVLMYAYRYATLAYVGGGFGAGIHNVLEPATYGIPVLFGPKYKKFQEAVDLLHAGSGFVVNNSREMQKVMDNILSDQAYLNEISRKAAMFVQNNTGATNQIFEKVKEFIVEPSSLL